MRQGQQIKSIQSIDFQVGSEAPTGSSRRIKVQCRGESMQMAPSFIPARYRGGNSKSIYALSSHTSQIYATATNKNGKNKVRRRSAAVNGSLPVDALS